MTLIDPATLWTFRPGSLYADLLRAAGPSPRTERELHEAFPVKARLCRAMTPALSRLAGAGYLHPEPDPTGAVGWTRTPEGEAALKRSELSGQFSVREAQVLLLLSLTPQTTDELRARFLKRHRHPVSRSVLTNALCSLRQQEFTHKIGRGYVLTLDGEELLGDARARICITTPEIAPLGLEARSA